MIIRLLLGCTGPDPGAIEITGYLDADRVSFARAGEDLVAAGLDGAAEGTVALANDRTGEGTSVAADADGAFVLSVIAATGDLVRLTVDGAEDEVELAVVDPSPFPDHSHFSAVVDPHEAEVVDLEVVLVSAQIGQVWAVNRERGTTAVLASTDGITHLGTVAGVADEVLTVYFVFDSGASSTTVEVPIVAR